MRWLVIVSLFLAACVSSADGVQTRMAETEAARPTETAVPATETIEPTATSTNTPTPTSTPDLTATAIVEATQSTEALLSRIEQALDMHGLSIDEGQLGWYSEDAITVINDSEEKEGTSLWIADNQSYSDFVLHANLISNGEYGCGIILRWEKPSAR